MDERVARQLIDLPDQQDVSDTYALLETCLARGDGAFLSELGNALAAAEREVNEQTWQYRAVLKRLHLLFAIIPGPGHVKHALRLTAASPEAGAALDAYTASLLAAGQSPKAVAAAFSEPCSAELRACLVQELVLRNVDIVHFTAIRSWTADRCYRTHPLSRLPLTMARFEKDPPLPNYQVRSTSFAMPFGPHGVVDGRKRIAVQTPSLPPILTETTTRFRARPMSAAVANWTEKSNGRLEARSFRSDETVTSATIPQLLVGAGLESMQGADLDPEVLSIAECSPSDAWKMLFAAASSGGAYGNGLRGAYGRLAAWQSIAGLAGAPNGALRHQVETLVGECSWFGFHATTKWYEQVAWDFGLVSLSNDGRNVRILAATDTD